ncbi:hypothetical protein [Desulfovibrio piger]|uniref:hypothetical protein n=1 Tax=Desulfovibrio piger TaxID=901 RepID=UPI00138FEA5A|nr:hypothetical protein [Desulfovibrio piger]
MMPLDMATIALFAALILVFSAFIVMLARSSTGIPLLSVELFCAHRAEYDPDVSVLIRVTSFEVRVICPLFKENIPPPALIAMLCVSLLPILICGLLRVSVPSAVIASPLAVYEIFSPG